MKVAHIADTHIDERRRLDDTANVFEELADAVAAEGVDLIVHAGDFYERKSTPAEREVAAAGLVGLARHAPVFGVRGNHDALRDILVFNRLRSKHPIVVAEQPVAEHWCPMVTPNGTAACIPLPWFDKAHLVAGLPADTPRSEIDGAVSAAAGHLLLHLAVVAAQARAEGRIPIIVSHALVAGSKTSTGQVLRGDTVELNPHSLADTGAAYVALGHIHKPQSWAEGRVAYSGSTEAHDFGEPEQKSWRLVEVDENGFVGAALMPIGSARRIELFEVDWRESVDESVFAVCDYSPGALVRFRYQIRAEDLHLVDDELIKRAFEGAHTLKVEPVVEHSTRIRSEAIVCARTTWDKLLAYWEAKGIEMSDQQLDRLRMKLGEIETDDADVVATGETA